MPFTKTFQAWKSQHFNARTFQGLYEPCNKKSWNNLGKRRRHLFIRLHNAIFPKNCPFQWVSGPHVIQHSNRWPTAPNIISIKSATFCKIHRLYHWADRQTDRQTDRTNMRLDLFQQATYALCDTATPPSNNNNNKTEIYSISCCILCMIQLSRDSTVSRTLHTLHRSYQLILLLLQTGLVIYNKICKEELCGCVLWEVNPCVARRGRPCRRSKGVSFAYSPADATVTHYLLLQ